MGRDLEATRQLRLLVIPVPRIAVSRNEMASARPMKSSHDASHIRMMLDCSADRVNWNQLAPGSGILSAIGIFRSEAMTERNSVHSVHDQRGRDSCVGSILVYKSPHLAPVCRDFIMPVSFVAALELRFAFNHTRRFIHAGKKTERHRMRSTIAIPPVVVLVYFPAVVFHVRRDNQIVPIANHRSDVSRLFVVGLRIGLGAVCMPSTDEGVILR
jgi:hypothetical protein